LRLLTICTIAIAAFMASACGGAGGQSAGTVATTTKTTATPTVETDGDTGRMSEGEYTTFTTFDDKFIAEFQDWTNGSVTCARIGQTGDLAGFRDCLKEAWSGLEDDAALAYSNASDTFGDVAKDCLVYLKGYAVALNQAFTENQFAYKGARSLDFSLMTRTFKRLARVDERFSRADIAVRDACKPS
jgi:hypothetical protein